MSTGSDWITFTFTGELDHLSFYHHASYWVQSIPEPLTAQKIQFRYQSASLDSMVFCSPPLPITVRMTLHVADASNWVVVSIWAHQSLVHWPYTKPAHEFHFIYIYPNDSLIIFLMIRLIFNKNKLILRSLIIIKIRYFSH